MESTKPVNLSLEQAERACLLLEASGDFKVLRRMRPHVAPLAPPGAELAKVIILDTESTGLSPREDKLIEVGMIAWHLDVSTGAFVGEPEKRSWLEYPGFALEPHTVALTGLTDANLAGHSFDEASIAQFMKGADLVIAHSASHDRPFFEARFPRLNNFAWGCSLRQVDWMAAGAGSAKLEFLLFKLGYFHDAHRALPDCYALEHVVSSFKLPSGLTVLQHLIDASMAKDFHVFANGAPFETKDELKARGYFWEGERKLWHKVIAEEALDAEFEWLRATIYRNRPARVQVEVISARARYSDNPPGDAVSREWRSIGPQGESPPVGRSGGLFSGRY